MNPDGTSSPPAGVPPGSAWPDPGALVLDEVAGVVRGSGTMVAVLRYFAARGRAQPLRHALADAGVEFDDVRVTLAAWPDHRGATEFAGPFAALPTLSWGNKLVAETLPIASFIARRLGQYDSLDAGQVALLESVCSVACLDAMVRVAELIWADLLYPGVDLAAVAGHYGRALEKLGRLDGALPATDWLGGASPVVADFFAAEAFEAHRYLLGEAHAPALAARFPRLSALAEGVRARPALHGAWAARPAQFTAHPAEPDSLARLASAGIAAAMASRP